MATVQSSLLPPPPTSSSPLTLPKSSTSSSNAHSLVKYDNPVLISKTEQKGPLKPSIGSHGGNEAGGPTLPKPHSPTGKSKLPPMEDKRSKSPSQTDDILNSILPRREWEENGQLWIQKVSSTPSTRLDVINLQEQLDLMLQRRQARETGICPVRRELYSQCFGKLSNTLF
ncbi:Axonemal dynein light intermediate polypeptide 1 [Coelomomyces lativittatus]|nr:Axonemal dynein light intermediate polypeptide 1 [Coelomomyces lativittatus]KAJ1497735.1 Axonemal dynein light intermediate polypeptide 1 [Coelomomyces lativittatus]KAJ1502827.1 Axonemal dynein light intermediate polypeptide 1 [Coelomomyces lativittatus]